VADFFVGDKLAAMDAQLKCCDLAPGAAHALLRLVAIPCWPHFDADYQIASCRQNSARFSTNLGSEVFFSASRRYGSARP
jgi:hypothetical protein